MNMSKMITFAAVAASAAIPMAANADMITTNGVTWTYSELNTTKKTVTLGGGTEGDAIVPKTAFVNALNIPWKMVIDGEEYTVNKIATAAFKDCTGLTGVLSIPDTVTVVGGNQAFDGCTGLTGISDFGGITTTKQTMFNVCTGLSGRLTIPDTCEYAFDNFAFNKCSGLTAIVVGSGVTRTGRYFGSNCPLLEGAWIKGRPTVASGTQAFTTIRQPYAFYASGALKVIFFGKNTQLDLNNGSTIPILSTATKGCKVFVPANGKWDNCNYSGTDTDVIEYGENQNLDLVVDEAAGTVTATPTTPELLVKMLEAAPTFKSAFALDMKISVTNTLDLTGVTITEDMTSGVTFDRLVFSAKTQTQLDAILGAFPATTPISIDPTGLTENMVVPDDYPNVHVKTVPGVTIKRTANGFMIVVQ